METILAVAVLVAVFFLVKKIRGPLPKSEPRFGGAPYDEETKTNPNAE
jgi:hypothetical protein